MAGHEQALEILLGPQLEPIVDMVAWTAGPDLYEVASAEGRVRFTRRLGGAHPAFTVERVEGRDPLADQSRDRFATLDDERAGASPGRRDNAYPLAFEQFAQLFDHPSAPDLCVIHSAAHNWEDQGGHLGEHGSLGVVQARAPFVAAGAGIRRLGHCDVACRLVDVAPTILALLGVAPDEPGDAGYRAPDGEPIADILEPGQQAAHVIGLLFDGTNANVLYDLAARGQAPHVARLIEEGVAARHGAVASLPTVTLANHTSILTGCHPGHHGILHNAWIDRATGRQVVTNSPATWSTAMTWLWPDVETIHETLARRRPLSRTVSINEPCDRGAGWSTFEQVRRGRPLTRAPGPDALPDATQRFVRPSKDYRWSSRSDHTAVEQFRQQWPGRPGEPPPAFCWVNFTLTDAAFHEGGPYSEMAAAAVGDTDARLGRILEVVERSGRWADTAFVLMADHGMEQTDRAVRGDWDQALRAAGVEARDEGYGLLYL